MKQDPATKPSWEASGENEAMSPSHGERLNRLFQNAEYVAADGQLYGYYVADEREQVLYEGLVYVEAEGRWRARFRARQPAFVETVDLDYSDVETAGCLLHASRVKPSQSLRALADFHDLIAEDWEAT